MITYQCLFQIGIIPLAALSILIASITISDNLPKYPNEYEKLLLLQVIFANGELDTQPFLPQSPTDADIFWLNESSILSLIGQKRAYKLGRTLKNKYELYLQNYDFTPDLVASRTSYLHIMQATLQCVHAGLFPTFPGAQIISVNIDWRPIPYAMLPKNEDVYIHDLKVINSIRNITLDETNKETKNSGVDFPENGTQMKQVLDSVSNYLHYNVTLSDMVLINEYLIQERKKKHLSEEWTNTMWANHSKALVDEFWDQFAMYHNLTAVPLFDLFLKNIRKKIDGKLPNARKLHLVSGHNLNIAAIMAALTDWSSKNGTITPCSYILTELVQEIKTGYYKIYFYFGNGTDLENPIQFTPKNCANDTCTIFEFTKILNQMKLF